MVTAPARPYDGGANRECTHMVDDGFDRDGRMSLRHRAFWTVVGAASTVLLYLAIVCALPRGPVGY